MKIRIFIFQFFKVTNDSNNSRSSSTDNQSISGDEHYVRKRRPRRVPSLVKFSIEKMINDNQPAQINDAKNTKQNSTISLVEKRPFPFGQW